MVIAAGLASATCIGFTLLYVAGFYLFKQDGSRNDPKVIRARFKAVTVASVASAFIVWYMVDKQDMLTALGLNRPKLISDIISPLLLTVLLFLGPLSIMFFDRELPFQKHFDFQRDVVEIFTTLLGQRNYIVAPLTEEFVFRSCMIAVLHQANYSRNYLIFVSPLYFGIGKWFLFFFLENEKGGVKLTILNAAHLHHAWDNYNKMNRTSRALKNALLSSSFQFLYTTLFGWYASYLFLRTGNLMAPVLSHSFCNIMGFPDFSSISHRSNLQKAGKNEIRQIKHN